MYFNFEAFLKRLLTKDKLSLPLTLLYL